MRHVLAALAVLVVVCVPASAATLTWNGNVSTAWSDAGNWSPAAVPANGDSLIFPASASQFECTTFAVTLASMTFDAAYSLSSSNTVAISGAINITAGGQTVSMQTPLRLAGANTWSLGANALAASSIDVNGQSLNATQSAGGVLSISDLSGTGSVGAHGGIVRLSQATFSGTINVDALEIEQGNILNASVIAHSVRGNGFIKSLSVTGDITPTVPSEGGNPFLSIGFGLTLTNTVYHLTVDTVTPWIVSSGSTSLSNVTLSLTSGLGGPQNGQSLTVIDAQATVSGTFSGLPEGAAVGVGGATYAITYVGGADAHDVVLLWTEAGGRTWTGTAGQSWSSASNWSPAGVPPSGADLLFPQGAPLTSTNDLASATVGKLTINDLYAIGGNAFTLNGGILRGGPAGAAHINANVTLGASQTFASTETLPLIFGGTFNVNGRTLTTGDATFSGALTGSGSLTSSSAAVTLGPSSHSFAGSIINTRLTLNGSVPAANLVHVASALLNAPGLTVNGEQTIGDVAIVGDLTLNHPSSDAVEILHTGVLKFEGAGDVPELGRVWSRYLLEVNGSQSDRIDAHGSVSVTNALLIPSAVNAVPIGQVYTIVANDGTDAVTGHFSEVVNGAEQTLSEGAIFTIPGTLTFPCKPNCAARFRISYTGNDGNDVTLTALDPITNQTSTTTLTSNGPTVSGQPAVFSVVVQPPSASGFIVFRIDGFDVATSELAAGLASFTTSGLTLGPHQVSAFYPGDATFGESRSATITHNVVKADTTMTANTPQSLVTVPATVPIIVTVSPVAPATGAPTGSVAIQDGGNFVGSGFLVSGSATVLVTLSTIGPHPLSVTYSGDGKFNGSSTTLTLTGVSVAIDASDVSTTEGDFGTHSVDVPIRLSAARSSSVAIVYHTESGSATAGEDFVSTSGTLTIPAGSLQGTVSITINGDVKPEVDERFALVIDSASEGSIVRSRIIVTIVDDDVAFTRTSGLVYATPGGNALTLDLLTPIGAATGPRPAVVALGGIADQATVRREAVRGYIVVQPVLRATFAANIFDAKAVIRWMRANAGQYGIDSNHIGVWGIGNGGNLAALLGTSDVVSTLADLGEGNAAASSRVMAIVDFYGETNYVALAQTPASCTVDYTSLFGCNPAQCPELAGTANPTLYVTHDDAPALIVHGSSDCAVPIAQSAALNNALKAATVDSTLMTVDGGHGGAAFATDEVLQAVDAFLDKYLTTPAPSRKRAVHH
jgi:acetyl esterase/lipase